MEWKDVNVIVTGGASFISSHLVDELVNLGANVTVIDNLSSGKLENLSESMEKIRFIKEDLEYIKRDRLIQLFKDVDIVFHLAAVHGGRGYIDTHPADVSSNFSIDHHVFDASCICGAEKVIFASSACVYPPSLQKDAGSEYFLKEEDSDISDLEKPLSADREYGWGKLMGEIQLKAFVKQYDLKGCSLRFVTVYGERENETHSIIALIYKAFEEMDPYIIWGSGNQERDFTYVKDIVCGMIKAAENNNINNGISINLGTGVKYKIKEVTNSIFNIMNFHPKKVIFDTSKPVGVVSRGLNISKAKEILGWEPKFSLQEGLKRTIEWYLKTHKRKGHIDEKILMERH